MKLRIVIELEVEVLLVHEWQTLNAPKEATDLAIFAVPVVFSERARANLLRKELHTVELVVDIQIRSVVHADKKGLKPGFHLGLRVWNQEGKSWTVGGFLSFSILIRCLLEGGDAQVMIQSLHLFVEGNQREGLADPLELKVLFILNT